MRNASAPLEWMLGLGTAEAVYKQTVAGRLLAC